MWLYYTLFYWLIPTVIAVVGLWVADKPWHLLNFVIHGEFLIYAITLVAGSTRLIAKDMPNSIPFVNRQGFNLWSHIMIFPAIFVYGLLRYINATEPNSPLNTYLIVIYSVVLLVGAFYFSYNVFLIDAQRGAPGDIQRRAVQAIAHSPDRLNEQFEEIQRREPQPAVLAGQPEQVVVQAAVEDIDVAEAVAGDAIVHPGQDIENANLDHLEHDQ